MDIVGENGKKCFEVSVSNERRVLIKSFTANNSISMPDGNDDSMFFFFV